jgi:cysteine-S-conjugate beta-lyase
MQWLDNPSTRRDHHSLKWSTYPDHERPLWVADMDCRPPPCVNRVLQDALAHGVFGYGIEPPGFREAWVTHLKLRHDWCIDPDWIVPVAGVVPAMRMALMAHPDITDVVVPTPCYPYFAQVPTLEKRALHPVALTRHSAGSHASLQPAEGAIAQALQGCHGPSAILWCNPQNPGGTVYGEDAIRALCATAQAHQALVVSDEIWADLLLNPTARHVPLGRIASPEHPTITLMAATKTFNVAGFSCAVAIIPHLLTRERFSQLQLAMPHVSPLAFLVTEVCLREGWDWHQSLLTALRANRDRVAHWVAQFPGFTCTHGDASFLSWISQNLGAIDLDQALARAGVRLSGGRNFGDPSAVRLNFGCSPAILEEALMQMDPIFSHLTSNGDHHD